MNGTGIKKHVTIPILLAYNLIGLWLIVTLEPETGLYVFSTMFAGFAAACYVAKRGPQFRAFLFSDPRDMEREMMVLTKAIHGSLVTAVLCCVGGILVQSAFLMLD